MKKDLGKKYFHKHLFCLTNFTIESFIIDEHDHLTMCINKTEAGENYSAMISLSYLELDTMLNTVGKLGYEIELLIAEALSSQDEMPAIINVDAKFQHHVRIEKCTLVTQLFCMSMKEDDVLNELFRGSHENFYCFVVKEVKLD